MGLSDHLHGLAMGRPPQTLYQHKAEKIYSSVAGLKQMNIIWDSMQENLSSRDCEQRRRPTCASGQSDQSLCYSLTITIIS